MLAAVIQCNGQRYPWPRQAAYLSSLVRKAAARGARLVALPEAALGPLEDGENEVTTRHPLIREFAALALENRIWLIPGTFWEKTPGQDKPYNTAWIFRPDGRVVGKYRKRFLFDVRLPSGKQILESSQSRAGHKPFTFRGPFGKAGLATCFDLRSARHFLDLHRGGCCELLIIPSNFTHETGKDHFLTLLRARAIESQSFVLAPDQCGPQKNGHRSFGNSCIIDPWGRFLARAGSKGTRILYADLDFKMQKKIRKTFILPG